MPIKHKKMTIQKHIETGEKMKAIIKLQDELYNDVAIAFGKTSKPAIFIRKLQSQTRNVILELDSELARITTREEWDQNKYGKIYY